MEVKIYYKDTDCGGVVYYANYLDYFERARTEWMEKKGVSIKKLADWGIIFIVRRVEVDYKSPAKYGEVLKIETKIGDMTKVSITFIYKIKEKETGRLIVQGITKMVCIDNSLKPRRMPEEVLKKLAIAK